MSFFSKSEPALTKCTKKVSLIISTLGEADKLMVAKTVNSLVYAIKHMSSMPSEITDELWGALVTIARKVFTGSDPDMLMDELRAGMSSELASLIDREARK